MLVVHRSVVVITFVRKIVPNQMTTTDNEASLIERHSMASKRPIERREEFGIENEITDEWMII
jgi:hypothetical protein